jgi:iron-sulfur cluster assembly accessory protein
LKRILGGNKYILFGAKGGGCNGFEYILSPVDTRSDNDELVIVSDIPILVCHKSMFLIMGTEIHWKEDMMGQCFEFTNPSASGTCGCGATFSVN